MRRRHDIQHVLGLALIVGSVLAGGLPNVARGAMCGVGFALIVHAAVATIRSGAIGHRGDRVDLSSGGPTGHGGAASSAATGAAMGAYVGGDFGGGGGGDGGGGGGG